MKTSTVYAQPELKLAGKGRHFCTCTLSLLFFETHDDYDSEQPDWAWTAYKEPKPVCHKRPPIAANLFSNFSLLQTLVSRQFLITRVRSTEFMLFQPVFPLFTVKGACTVSFWSVPKSEPNLLGYMHIRVCIRECVWIWTLYRLITHSNIAVPASGNIPLVYIVDRKALVIHVHIDNIIVGKINILWACQTHLSKPRVRYVASDTHDCVGSYAVFFLIIAFHRVALVHCQPQ